MTTVTEKALRDAAIHDATTRDDIVAYEVATGKTFKRELPALLPSTPNVEPTHDLIDPAVQQLVERIIGRTIVPAMNVSFARSMLKRWAVAQMREATR
ncbi:hypothetical protein [Phycicoccus sp.]|uniref:hypothetical protein n=1 Tax=Phycicoccus sp. TaxID=1902410 RepID=UPI002C9813AB|nr:hypothetical protein [Phycicoccus sp.]HMM95361.1 hypothetical protein [Phycicoccus sp.]